MKDLLLLFIVGVLVLENVLASDIEVTVIRMDTEDDSKTDGLFDLETFNGLKTMKNSISRTKLISSSLDDDLDAKVHNALKKMRKETEIVSEAKRCCCYEYSLVYLHHLHDFLRDPTERVFEYNYWYKKQRMKPLTLSFEFSEWSNVIDVRVSLT
ncbi:Protein CBG10294 [Caenorhabditis briggsae]|uniref:Protein CBG10294 n=1 Tax=Caenorhabditis briggsae TaxID=6238 RepID=A8XAN7_CAEBR|nr:Protein CBG10294 [Caenorhabditis briggsae]CAP29702.2 Protein CBG10294 [Caenorhabditis briggsae]